MGCIKEELSDGEDAKEFKTLSHIIHQITNMSNFKCFLMAVVACVTTVTPMRANTQQSGEVLDMIIKVNNYWQANNTPYVRSFWDHAAYHTGNMEAYRLTGRADWYAYTDKWCRHNEWKGAKSDDVRNWKYKT